MNFLSKTPTSTPSTLSQVAMYVETQSSTSKQPQEASPTVPTPPYLVTDPESQSPQPRNLAQAIPEASQFRTVLTCVVWLLLGIAVAASIGAFLGFLATVAGHALLRATHHSGYDAPLSSSMKLGAVGGAVVIGLVIVVLAVSILSKTTLPQENWSNRWPNPLTPLLYGLVAIAVGAASCAVGIAIMREHSQGVQQLDTVHAVRAGALGAAILICPVVLHGLLIIIAW
ncbi:hypothetical protein F5I97DRAFT_1441006 [Phlebopus sp. FC_14]|nr:hypothetical protein F5I97DRAFT_1441006 [Phlebopus sp. FC_14]